MLATLTNARPRFRRPPRQHPPACCSPPPQRDLPSRSMLRPPHKQPCWMGQTGSAPPRQPSLQDSKRNIISRGAPWRQSHHNQLLPTQRGEKTRSGSSANPSTLTSHPLLYKNISADIKSPACTTKGSATTSRADDTFPNKSEEPCTTYNFQMHQQVSVCRDPHLVVRP